MIGAKVSGVDAAIRDLARVTEHIADEGVVAARAAGKQLVSSVRPQLPRDSGDLQDSLMMEELDDGALVGYDESVRYAGWIEFGGSRGRPRAAEGRYLWPTAKGSQGGFAAAANSAVKRAIGEMRWSRTPM